MFNLLFNQEGRSVSITPRGDTAARQSPGPISKAANTPLYFGNESFRKKGSKIILCQIFSVLHYYDTLFFKTQVLFIGSAMLLCFL